MGLVELPDPPAAWGWGWGWGKQAHLLVGVLAHSGRWRGVLVESQDQPHLIKAMDRVTGALGRLRPAQSSHVPRRCVGSRVAGEPPGQLGVITGEFGETDQPPASADLAWESRSTPGS